MPIRCCRECLRSRGPGHWVLPHQPPRRLTALTIGPTVIAKFRLVAYAEAVTYLMVLAGVVVLHGFAGPTS